MRLIDADAVVEAVEDEIAEAKDIDADPIFVAGLKLGLAYVNTAETVEAVQVVRCRECEYAHMTFGGECKYCDKWEEDEYLHLDGDFFCAFGKRRDEDDETD